MMIFTSKGVEICIISLAILMVISSIAISKVFFQFLSFCSLFEEK